DECGRHDLPGYAELVLEPGAATRLTACGKLLPVMVDLGLGFAVDDHRDRFGELEHRPAVESGEWEPVELECHDHAAALRHGSNCAIAGHSRDPRIAEDRDVEIRRRLGLTVEPQTRGNSLLDRHGSAP